MLAKIFPGILIVYLLARKRWQPLAWTAAFGALYVALGVLVLRPESLQAFVGYMLPRLSSGEAFHMLETPVAVALNHAMSGLILKLGLLGVPGMTTQIATLAGWLYTGALVGIAFATARRIASDGAAGELLLSLALLQLASLRSPFVPDTYALIAPIWITALLIAVEAGRRRRPFALFSLLVALACQQFVAPAKAAFDWPILVLLGAAAIPQLAALAVTIAAVRRSGALERPASRFTLVHRRSTSALAGDAAS